MILIKLHQKTFFKKWIKTSKTKNRVRQNYVVRNYFKISSNQSQQNHTLLLPLRILRRIKNYFHTLWIKRFRLITEIQNIKTTPGTLSLIKKSKTLICFLKNSKRGTLKRYLKLVTIAS